MATIDAPPAGTSKKSLRSKRLMRPAPNSSNKAAEEIPPLPTEESAKPETHPSKPSLDETSIALSDTDETLKASDIGKKDLGSEEADDEVFVEANESHELGLESGGGGGGGVMVVSPESPVEKEKEPQQAEVSEEEPQQAKTADEPQAEAIDEPRAEETIGESRTETVDEPRAEAVDKPRAEAIDKPQAETIDEPQAEEAIGEPQAEAVDTDLIQLLSSTSGDDTIPISDQALSPSPSPSPSHSSTLPVADDIKSSAAIIGRSISLRYNAAVDERRRPSVSSTKRRSIMLTSFVPPVGMSGGPNSSSSTRSSNDSHGDALATNSRSSSVGSGGDSGEASSIRLRPPPSTADASPQPLTVKSALASISEKATGGQQQQQQQQPEWVQRHKQEAMEKAEAEEKSADAAPQAYVARANTFSVQATQPASDRQRSASQTGAPAVAPIAAPSTGGLFAAVSSFFGRTSTQVSATESAQISARLSTTVAFPGMRPSHAAEKEEGESLELLHQLEAQNAQILGDNKARVFAQHAEPPPAAGDSAEDWDFWGALISDYDRVSRASPRKLARAVHAGIPAPIRGTVWQLMSGSRGADSAALGAEFRRLVGQRAAGEEQTRHEKLIRQDVVRTFPRDPYFREAGGAGQEGLYAVLRVYSLHDSEVGYCQGLAFVAGALLLHMPDEEAFCVLARLMGAYGLRGHFLPSMDDLHLRLFQLDHVLHSTLPRVARHLDAHGVKPTMYAAQWLMTLFAYRLPLALAVRLFDLVFAEGLDALLRVSVAVLKRSQARLLALDEMGAIIHYLNEGPLFAFYAHAAPDTLVRDANQITAVTPRLLLALRRRYVEEAERQLDEEDEKQRLRAECEALRKEISALRNTKPMDDNRLLAQKNVQLAVRNQQLEDALHDLEAALVQIKALYAESEDDRAQLAMKLDALRKALT
ncbi:GTPase-activating protein [Coemansia sp. BCRC 34301]|nr:GTPase-activating protein [Coemansia sp. BCRC 34301]